MLKIKSNSVTFSDGEINVDLPFLWLRDNCQCDECRITETQEKQFLLHSVPIDIAPKAVNKIDDNLIIQWPDKHESVIPIKMIHESTQNRYPEHKFWPENYIPEYFDWSNFLGESSTAIAALSAFLKFGVIILKNAPKESNSLELLSGRLGPIHETLFERIHNVSVTGHVYNVAHTPKGLPPHNDFASYRYQPSVQALHMLENECEGGESIIVDGWSLADDLKTDFPEYFSILKKFRVPFREFDEDNETYAEEPMIRCNSNGLIESFRFSNQLMQMIDPSRPNVQQFYEAYHEVSRRVHLDKYRTTFRLNGGEVLIVASLRVLHAREPFIPNGKRHLQDAYFVHDNIANGYVLLQSK